VVHSVGVGEILCLFFGELVERPEEAQIDCPLAAPSEEPRQGGSVVGLNKSKRDVVSAGFGAGGKEARNPFLRACPFLGV
jgi:hypothetical protein